MCGTMISVEILEGFVHQTKDELMREGNWTKRGLLTWKSLGYSDLWYLLLTLTLVMENHKLNVFRSMLPQSPAYIMKEKRKTDKAPWKEGRRSTNEITPRILIAGSAKLPETPNFWTCIAIHKLKRFFSFNFLYLLLSISLSFRRED